MKIEWCLRGGSHISSSPWELQSPFEAAAAGKRSNQAPPFLDRNPESKQSFLDYNQESKKSFLDYNQKQVLFRIQSPCFNWYREPNSHIYIYLAGRTPRCPPISGGDEFTATREPSAAKFRATNSSRAAADLRGSHGGKKVDSLSALPDDVLVNILDRLTVREAARTSILSKRWTQLCAKLSRLIISAQHFLSEGVSCTDISDDELVRINEAVVQAIESILARRNPGEHTIRLPSTMFYLRDDVPISIGQAVGHAMAAHLVENVKFSVMTGKYDIIDMVKDDLVTSARNFMPFFVACPSAFGGLIALDLENLRFGESDISNILIACKRLKRVRLYNCDSGDCSTLPVEHAHLSELSIVHCRLERVMLNWLPQLTRMVHEGWLEFQDPLFIGHVPMLEAVSLRNVSLSYNKMVKLSDFLSGTSVRDLKLGFDSEKIWVQPECPTQCLASVFRQLRFLNIVNLPEGYDLTWTMYFLEAAPLLKELYITVWDHECKMEMDEEKRKEESYSENKGVEWDSAAADFQHHSLVTLVMFGFESEDCFVSYVRRVLAAAVNLEDVFLYCGLECDDCPDKMLGRYPWTKRQRISLKKRMTAGIESFAIFHYGNMRIDHVKRREYPKCSLLEAKNDFL